MTLASIFDAYFVSFSLSRKDLCSSDFLLTAVTFVQFEIEIFVILAQMRAYRYFYLIFIATRHHGSFGIGLIKPSSS